MEGGPDNRPMTSKENQARTDFSALALSPAMLANLQQLGYTTMTPIQAASLPPALLGKDLIAQASTGSGKTAAFALALLANLNPRRFAVQALVLCPTRELADQVAKELDVDAIVVDNSDPAALAQARAQFPAHLDTIVNVPAPRWTDGDPRAFTPAQTAAAWRNALDAAVLAPVLTVQAMGFYNAASVDKTPQIRSNMSAAFVDATGTIVALPADSGFSAAGGALCEAPTSIADPYSGDFLIPGVATPLTVPAGAVQLRVSVDDCYFSDNSAVSTDPLRLYIKLAGS